MTLLGVGIAGYFGCCFKEGSGVILFSCSIDFSLPAASASKIPLERLFFETLTLLEESEVIVERVFVALDAVAGALALRADKGRRVLED